MSHKELTERAERWLRNTLHCRVVLRELVAYTRYGETPDAIGWVGGSSVLVECKTSRSDFKADLKKPFRINKHFKGLGNWRFYLTPPGLLNGLELPENWGWYEFDGNRVKHAGGVKYSNAKRGLFESCRDSEVAMLVSALARAGGEQS